VQPATPFLSLSICNRFIPSRHCHCSRSFARAAQSRLLLPALRPVSLAPPLPFPLPPPVRGPPCVRRCASAHALTRPRGSNLASRRLHPGVCCCRLEAAGARSHAVRHVPQPQLPLPQQPVLLLTMLLPGTCALRSKCDVEAAMFFKDALASEPCCIEAVPELLRLGAKEEDVRALLQVPHLCPPPPPPAAASHAR
jgi:hypothetical protein